MSELKPCPFCGGKARVSFKDKRWGGWNGKGDHRKVYSVQVICNKCHSRGKPITTDWLVNPNPYSSVYSGRYTIDSLDNPVIKKNTEMFARYVEQAIEAWNKRTERPKGRWEDANGNHVPFDKSGDYCPISSCYCSLCNDWLTASDEYAVKGAFCPNCGADMRGEGDE